MIESPSSPGKLGELIVIPGSPLNAEWDKMSAQAPSKKRTKLT